MNAIPRLHQLPAELLIDTALVEKMLVAVVHQEVTKVGFRQAVFGLSGGIDSALTAYLAARALGPENVTGIIMPYATSSPESLEDAQLVVCELGIQSVVIDITPQIDAYFGRPEIPICDDRIEKLRRGNKMARERMTILYDFSQAREALVLGTSNKTELLLGYGTLYGDMASAVNPLGDLYKSQVWQLAMALGVPEKLIEKVPTADLWSGQSDEQEIGYSYPEIDRLFHYLVDHRMDHTRLENMGFPSDLIRFTTRMLRISQYKRRLPVVAKLGNRTIDRDFRYPRDWGY